MRILSFTITNPYDWCLKIFLLFCPIIWLPGFTQNNLQMMIFNYGAVLLFGIGIILPKQREFKNYNLFLLLLLSMIVTIFRNPTQLRIGFLNIVFACLLYYSIVTNVKDIKEISKIFIWLFWINFIVLIFQLFNFNLVYKESVLCGLMAKSNHLAIFLAIIAPILFMQSWLYLILIGVILLLLQCYSALLAFVITVILLIINRVKNKRIVFAIIGGLGLGSIPLIIKLFGVYWYKIATRLSAWQFLLKESFINPLIGKGIGSFRLETEINNIVLGNMPVVLSYNEYFNFMYEFGLLFSGIFFVSMFLYYKRLTPEGCSFNPLFLSIISILVVCFFQDPLHITRLAVPIITILALFEASCSANKKEVLNVVNTNKI